MKNIIILCALFLLNSELGKAQELANTFDKSLQIAKAEGKNVMTVFSGSDWCKPCIQFKKEVLESTSFRTYSKDHLEILILDFPYSKKTKLSKAQRKHNEEMAELYNSEGSFPKILLFSSTAESHIEVYYKKDMSPVDFLEQLETRMTAL